MSGGILEIELLGLDSRKEVVGEDHRGLPVVVIGRGDDEDDVVRGSGRLGEERGAGGGKREERTEQEVGGEALEHGQLWHAAEKAVGFAQWESTGTILLG